MLLLGTPSSGTAWPESSVVTTASFSDVCAGAAAAVSGRTLHAFPFCGPLLVPGRESDGVLPGLTGSSMNKAGALTGWSL